MFYEKNLFLPHALVLVIVCTLNSCELDSCHLSRLLGINCLVLSAPFAQVPGPLER